MLFQSRGGSRIGVLPLLLRAMTVDAFYSFAIPSAVADLIALEPTRGLLPKL